MTCMHKNIVNKRPECNLLHDILNPPKHNKILNIHYSPILQGYINICKGEAKFKNFQILLDSVCSSTIIMVRPTKKISERRCDAIAQASG